MNNDHRKTSEPSLIFILALLTILLLKLSFVHTISWRWPMVTGSATFLLMAIQQWEKEKARRKDLS